MVWGMATWGASSFANDTAVDWFFVVEEAVDPGTPIAEALDDALSEADCLELDGSSRAIAAAELLASCAGQPPEELPDRIRAWTDAHLHAPHESEIELAVQAVSRVRAESELRDAWNEAEENAEHGWLRELEDLIVRLGRASQGNPATLTP